jgi:hypothetical protein
MKQRIYGIVTLYKNVNKENKKTNGTIQLDRKQQFSIRGKCREQSRG